ncbi:ABC transporter permease [Cuneatibacter sp. NSJ-177]|uniref:ABC transporter permease n=1 Tax=Cuneatibacter sp. NSJ-177 TaxID=2931401 RepID=UPI001FD0BCB7|nr:ABC transporter permease [Cuneatibacter sp. NSJ-177]MCJ7836811.1 ABC transporter permease [Cuneatibacter sp. NSJ-177]
MSCKKWMVRAWPLLVLLLIACFAGWIAPYDPWEMSVPFLEPSGEHLLGTNDLGQDILSELIYGARTSLLVGITAAVVITLFGSFAGAFAAYFGGWADRLIMVFINIALAVPSLPLIIVLSAFLKRSTWNIILCICLTGWVGTARIVRSQAMQLKEMGFIRSCRTMGCGPFYIITRHLLPNLKEIILTKGLLSVASAMLTETSISYLGLGPMTAKSWGTILNDAFRAGGIFNGYWWWFLPPILCISLTIFCFLSLKGDESPAIE